MAIRIVNSSDATAVLASPDFDVVRYGDRYGQLAERLGLDFDAIRFALDHIPLCLRGEDHAAQRARIGRIIAENRPALIAAMPAMLDQGLACLAEPGEHDVMAHCIGPIVDGTISALCGSATGLTPDTLVSRVFSQSLGIAKRQRMEAEMAALRDRMVAAFPGLAPQDLGARLALAILGHDALVGTLARSIHAHIDACAGGPLNARPFDKIPTHTGVPYIDREALTQATVGGQTHAPGDHLRCQIGSLEAEGPAERMRFFGAGAHVCLGKPLSLELLGGIRDRLARMTTRVTITDYRLRKDDVFLLPETFTITVTE